jgi:hypothetical protein
MVAPTRFGIILPSSRSVPSAFWEMLNWGAVDRILWMCVLCLVGWCVHTTNAPWRWQCNAETCRSYHTQLINGMNNWCICWFSLVVLQEILIFKGLTARRLYKSFGVKGFTAKSPVRIGNIVHCKTRCNFGPHLTPFPTYCFHLANGVPPSRVAHLFKSIRLLASFAPAYKLAH